MNSSPRILIAGIGNIFLGDDAFGVHVARALLARELPAGVLVVDYGIRALDLVYALCERWDAVILVDAVPRDELPGTLFVIEPALEELAPAAAVDGHSMDPLKVLALAQSMGAQLSHLRLVGCQPSPFDPDDSLALLGELSPPVARAIEPAADMVLELIHHLAIPSQPMETSCT